MDAEERIKGVIRKITGLKMDDISLEIPRPGFGDYAFTCFSLARTLKKNPKDIAADIAKKIAKEMPKELAKVEAVNGYVNFFVDKSNLAKSIVSSITEEEEKYGSLAMKGKVLIEHTSINPNASPHVGRVRNAIIGDTLVRLFRFHGYKTEVHYYVNDVSKQMALLVLGSKGNETFDDLLNLYVIMSKKLEQEPDTENQVFEILRKIEDRDKATIAKLNRLVSTAINGQKSILGKLGIHYDLFDYESIYVASAKLKSILKELEKTKRLEKDVEGRYILEQGKMSWNFEREMKSPVLVLTRSDGTGLYVLRDMAYTIDKLARTKSADDMNIIVLGEDQKLYFKQLSAAIELLGYRPPKIVHYSFILLKDKKGAKKMSTRKGEVILVSDFIKEAVDKARKEIKQRKRDKVVDIDKVSESIGIGAVRYSIAKVEQDKSVIFDWHEALNFEGNSAPYLQYTYARASNIISKLGKHTAGKENYNNIDDKEFALVKELARFQVVAKNSFDQLQVHLLANYAYSLAQKFNDFYESCPVIKASADAKVRRIALVNATRQILANVLGILGIPVLEAM